ncbi:MAG: leucine-rich repeat domain-containing protein, partial [Clostridia bacterium]
SNNANFKSIDGDLYSKDGSTLIQYAIGKTATIFTIPASVTNIGYGAFYGCSSLTSVTIPASVTTIGGSAFSGCIKLTSITIPAGVTSIGYGAFNGCRSLTIYAEVEKISKPAGWSNSWNSHCPVVWGYKI